MNINNTTTFGKIKILMLKGEKGDSGDAGNYSTLSNKPSINDVELVGNKSASDLGFDNIYLKLTGGTLSGNLNGTNADFSGTISGGTVNGTNVNGDTVTGILEIPLDINAGSGLDYEITQALTSLGWLSDVFD